MQLQGSKKREEMHTFAVGGLKIPHDFPNWIPGSAVWPSVKSVERERVKQGGLKYSLVGPDGKFSKAKRYKSRLMSEMG